MTDIAFHFNVPDKLTYTCRLLRKAVGSGGKLIVIGSNNTLQQLDQDLWTFMATEFVPHCVEHTRSSVMQRTPVLLAQDVSSAMDHNVLVNLGEQVPAGFERFSRVLEIVGLDEDDRQYARQRWKQYSNAGFNLIRHDLDQKAAR